MTKTMKVAAPRQQAWSDYEKSSRIVVAHVGRQHPANAAYHSPEGEVCICEGQGVKGDPGGQHEPWVVFPYPEIVALIREGRLVEVRPGADTGTLRIGKDDLASLELSPRARKGLTDRRVLGVTDLAAKLRDVPDPVAWLTSVDGIGEATARDLLEQLEARG